MTAILLHTFIIPAGTKMEHEDWNNFIENHKAAYLPEREKDRTPGSEFCEFPEDGNFPEFGIVNLTTTEPIFFIKDAMDFSPFTAGHNILNSWAVEDMNEGANEEFRRDIHKIYEDIQSGFWKTAKSMKRVSMEAAKTNPNLIEKLEKEPFPVSMLTLWTVKTSHDFESGIEEIDRICYEGPAHVVLTQPK